MSRATGEDHGTAERVTVSTVPVSRESRVSSRSLDVDASYLDRLLLASCELPVERGDGAVVEFLVRALGEIFPELGVGVCLAPPAPASSRSVGRASNHGQRIFRYIPDGEDRRGDGIDPTRLFPGFAIERVVDVNDDGTTLHVAGADPSLLSEDAGETLHVVNRAAVAMRRGIELARGHERAREDAANLRALNSHMVQAEKLASLGQLAAGVVHELNNPLTSIVAYTDWLIRKTGPNGDTDSLERLRRIGESAGRILRFTRDLVAYARPSREMPSPVSIQNVIDQALAFCEHVLAEHGATVNRDYGEPLPAVRGMPEQLAQVFVNLFTNACHAMPEGGGGRLAVHARLSGDGGMVEIRVEDNGHGIATEHVAAIFTPFFTTKGEGRGTGLGLSIVKNIMDNHGGEIFAERSDLGGARFVLSFPVPR